MGIGWNGGFEAKNQGGGPDSFRKDAPSDARFAGAGIDNIALLSLRLRVCLPVLPGKSPEGERYGGKFAITGTI
jgi:hypothetical protein